MAFIEAVRFIAKVAVTPVIVLSFGFFAVGGLLVMYPAFKFIDFVTQSDTVTFADMREESWEMFTEPLEAVWSKH